MTAISFLAAINAENIIYFVTKIVAFINVRKRYAEMPVTVFVKFSRRVSNAAVLSTKGQ
jgi:hypothetical protein